jgi:hypothetical protein
MGCSCASCLAQASDEDLAALESLLLAKAGLPDDPNQWLLDAEDAEIGSTTFQAYASELGQAEWREKHSQPLTEEQKQAALARAEYQRARGLELLSDSARERLGPVLERVSGALEDMTAGRINPIQAGAKMAAEFSRLEAEGGGTTAGPDYSPYEFSRLARTEAAFANDAAEAAAIERDYPDADSTAFDELAGGLPLHPQCLCRRDTSEGDDGKWYVVLDPSASACDLCLEVAAEIEAAIG